jgi:hypothetical protein
LRRTLALLLIAVIAGCGGSERESGATTASTQRAVDKTGDRAQVRPEPRHPKRTDSPLRRLRILADDHPRDERLTEVARSLLPIEAKVWCWTEQRWSEIERDANSELPPEERTPFAGLADIYSLQIHLAPWVCDALSEDGLERAPELDVADALLVLAHETRHLSVAGTSEHLAECKALQRVARTAELFGLSRARARRLARIAWEDVYRTVPPEYRSPECRPGGALDEDPADPEFP